MNSVTLSVVCDFLNHFHNVTLNQSESIDECIRKAVQAFPELNADEKYVFFNPDPKVTQLDFQWLSGELPLSVGGVFRSGDKIELCHAPLTVKVYVATENVSQLGALVGGKKFKLDPTKELVLCIPRLRAMLGSLLPDEEHCFAVLERDRKNASRSAPFSVAWMNATSPPRKYKVRDGTELLLWPLRLFQQKPAESFIGKGTLEDTVRFTKKENASKCEKRLLILKFNLLFVFASAKARSAETVINLEHYLVSPVEEHGKKQVKFRMEKVVESFARTQKQYWFVFDDSVEAQIWHGHFGRECANRMAATKLPPPRVMISDKAHKHLGQPPKDAKSLPLPPAQQPEFDLVAVGSYSTANTVDEHGLQPSNALTLSGRQRSSTVSGAETARRPPPPVSSSGGMTARGPPPARSSGQSGRPLNASPQTSAPPPARPRAGTVAFTTAAGGDRSSMVAHPTPPAQLPPPPQQQPAAAATPQRAVVIADYGAPRESNERGEFAINLLEAPAAAPASPAADAASFDFGDFATATPSAPADTGGGFSEFAAATPPATGGADDLFAAMDAPPIRTSKGKISPVAAAAPAAAAAVPAPATPTPAPAPAVATPQKSEPPRPAPTAAATTPFASHMASSDADVRELRTKLSQAESGAEMARLQLENAQRELSALRDAQTGQLQTVVERYQAQLTQQEASTREYLAKREAEMAEQFASKLAALSGTVEQAMRDAVSQALEQQMARVDTIIESRVEEIARAAAEKERAALGAEHEEAQRKLQRELLGEHERALDQHVRDVREQASAEHSERLTELQAKLAEQHLEQLAKARDDVREAVRTEVEASRSDDEVRRAAERESVATLLEAAAKQLRS